MNLSEFKSWFEGFTENISGAPNQKQWKRICDKVGLIKEASATSYPVFVDRYARPYWPYWQPLYAVNGVGGGGLAAAMQCSNNIADSQNLVGNNLSFDSQNAFKALGQVEANSMTGAS